MKRISLFNAIFLISGIQIDFASVIINSIPYFYYFGQYQSLRVDI
uniref:Uncharacterized protein n=1 Tax=viral metagenome TaxID=1070528 RepID=A0A6C0BCT0_9ZZZZ